MLFLFDFLFQKLTQPLSLSLCNFIIFSIFFFFYYFLSPYLSIILFYMYTYLPTYVNLRLPTYLSISTHLPTYDYLPSTYLCQPTYPYQPTSTYLSSHINTPTHLCLLTNTYQPTSTYYHLPTFLPLPIPKYQYRIATDPGASMGLVIINWQNFDVCDKTFCIYLELSKLWTYVGKFVLQVGHIFIVVNGQNWINHLVTLPMVYRPSLKSITIKLPNK